MEFLKSVVAACPEAVYRDIKYLGKGERVKKLRLRTALEICICSAHCDAPVLNYLLQQHCTLVGPRETFLGDHADDVDNPSDANSTHGSNRFSTLLHWALKAKAKNWLTNVVIDTAARNDLAQKLCMKQDSEGHTPLHLAIMLNAAPDVVEHLLDICPESVSILDDRGRTSLHLVCDVCTVPTAAPLQTGSSCLI